MPYFAELDSSPEYPSNEPDFRYVFNYNSGGGNQFLSGRPHDETGNKISATALDGKEGIFQFKYSRINHQADVIPLDDYDSSCEIIISLDDEDASYDLKPRAIGQKQMKFGVRKHNPSKVIQAFLMLPEGCGVRRSFYAKRSVLSFENYWLDSMRLDLIHDSSQPEKALLNFSDPVFASNARDWPSSYNKKKKEDTDKNPEPTSFFTIDIEQRIAEVIRASADPGLPADIKNPLLYFARLYSGEEGFIYTEARQMTDALMEATARAHPLLYSGLGDPLPFLTLDRGQQVTQKPQFETGLDEVDSRSRIFFGAPGKPQFETGLDKVDSRNRIIFGAPGTGKSHKLDVDKDSLLDGQGTFERVTFHPDYTYANFVGTYKPVPSKNEKNEDTITYEYVPGPFMRIISEALRNGKTDAVVPHLLLIEEINRAPAAAVFGDVFQLLDRDGSNASRYPIQCSVDMKKYLSKTVGGSPEDFQTLRIPDNLFIWGSMNNADQGVYPMDTAFKRRWDFSYIGIDDNDEELRGKFVSIGAGSTRISVEWNELRKSINDFLASLGINEDKQMGPYFLGRSVTVPEDGNVIDGDKFCDAFKEKVIMYLFEDAARQYRSSLFEGCDCNGVRYSDICREFDKKGIFIFNSEIVSRIRKIAQISEKNEGAEFSEPSEV